MQVITAFKERVSNHRMLKKLGIHDTLSSMVRLFDIAEKCAKAEEGLLFDKVKTEEDLPEGSKSHKKHSESKRKPTAVLAAEPDAKQLREDSPEPKKKQANTHPLCVYHDRHGHSTENSFDLKRLREKRKQEEGSRGHCRVSEE